MRLLKTTQSRWLCHAVATCLTLLIGSEAAQANSRIDELKRCLQDFDGIEWKLPYRPPLRIRSCATPAVNYDVGDKTPAGHRRLELIGELTLGDEASQLSSDERYAALQLALHTHFDALFKQRGYRLVSTEQGNARTKYSAYTQCMLRGGNCTEDEPAPPKPPIPYVSLARYARQAGAQTITITYKAEAKNTWSISLDGVPATAGAR
jgi:hypothetical protein